MKHHSIAAVRFIPRTRRKLSASAIVLSLVFAIATFGEPLGSSWTYQGQLRRNGAAYNGTCDFQFSLWDAASGGAQEALTQSINGVNVANGLFTVVLDFGHLPASGVHFTGDALWLGTSVQCSGDSGFTALDPRQPITAAPYALSLRPGASIIGPGLSTPIGTSGALNVRNTEDTGIGVSGVTAKEGYGVFGGASGGLNSAGVYGINTNGAGIWGETYGSGSAIYGATQGTGYAGQFLGPVDVAGRLTVNATSGEAITGKTTSVSSVGVYGVANEQNSAGVLGQSRDSAGIWGRSTGAGPAVYGQAMSTGLAGRFGGSVVVEGNLVVQGTVSKSSGTFKIDHPLDPANKFLSHSFVESPDMMNIYNGSVTTDASGSATVLLPEYFAALNRDYRYQLTVLGQFAQAIVSRKIAGNSFEIRTNKPGVEVSWQVTGIRQDAYAQAHPIVVEEAKPAEEQGLYLFPAGFGAGEEERIGRLSQPAAPQTEQNITKITK